MVINGSWTKNGVTSEIHNYHNWYSESGPFGVNHGEPLGTAGWTDHQIIPMPVMALWP